MRKFIISAAVAASALAVASPAAAQYYPQPQPQGYGYNAGYGYNHGNGANWLFNFGDQRYARMMQDRVSRVRTDIRQMGSQRILSRSEVRTLDIQARNLQDRIFRASRNGLNRNETRNLDRSVRRLEERVVREASDWNRRSGARRYNAYNYNQYWTQYGNNTYGDRDQDGRNDRYEDDHGTRHDSRR